MKIVWDLDGTLLKDTGKDYDKPAAVTPLWTLMEYLDIHTRAEHICVTGRTEIPTELVQFFDKKICRPWMPKNWDQYYPQYFQWKVDTIRALQPDLVFEDDQQITRYLIQKGIKVIWVPMYAFMGDLT